MTQNKKKKDRGKKMKGQIGKNRSQWLTINSLSGFSRLIQVSSIQQIEITADVIEVQIGKDWKKIRRYNQGTIEVYLREMDRSFRDCISGKGTEEREAKERQITERYYLEYLDRNLKGKDWEERRKKAWEPSISWLRDKDFNHLKQQLQSLADCKTLSTSSGP